MVACASPWRPEGGEKRKVEQTDETERERGGEPALGLERNPRPSRGRCLSPRLTASHFRPFQVAGKIRRLRHGAEAQHMFSFSISAVCFAATSVPSKGPVDVGEEAETLANQTLELPTATINISLAHHLIYVSSASSDGT